MRGFSEQKGTDKVKVKRVSGFFVILLTGILGFSAVSWSGETASTVPLLGPADRLSLEKMPEFKKLFNSDPASLEKDKINYLLARIRFSRYEFIRNGTVYKGPRAAYHLMSKYVKRLGLVKTSAEFIDNIASRSNTSGEIYRIRYPDGKEYPVREILHNELYQLAKILAEKPVAA